MWDWQRRFLLGDPADLAFDDRILLRAPAAAVPGQMVPVTLDARAIPDIRQIILATDYGSPPRLLTFRPGRIGARLSFRFRFEGATPLRAAVETVSGTWHVAVTMIATTPGCGDPAEPQATAPDPAGTLRARVWPSAGRLRLLLAGGAGRGPAERPDPYARRGWLDIATAAGAPLAGLDLFAPLGPAPALTLHLAPDLLRVDPSAADPGLPAGTGPVLRVTGMDMGGAALDVAIRVGTAP